MKQSCTGIVLSGGRNTRMGGLNKALLTIAGQQVIDRIIHVLEDCFEQILIVTRQPYLYKDRQLTVVNDIFEERSPLSGIHSGLINMKSEYGFITGCDIPLINREVIRILIDEMETDYDVIVPASGTFFQPLCAIYSRRCIPFIENMLRRGFMKTDRLYAEVRLKTVSYNRFLESDPELSCFFNVNTPEDLTKAEALIQAERVKNPFPELSYVGDDIYS